MQSQVSEISAVMVEVNVEVPWDDVKKEIDGTYTKLGRTAKVKGFRPGKVPRNVLKQLYSKQVKAEVVQSVVERGLSHAVTEHSIEVVAVPEMDEPPVIKDGEALTFKAKVEVRPTIEKVDYAGIELERASVEVEDSAVTEELEKLRSQNAELQVPDPMRKSAETDVLVCDYTVKLDGEDKADMAAEGRAIDIGEGLLPEFREAMVGRQPEDTFEFSVTFPEGHGDLEGKTAEFSVVAKELKEKVMPDLDDEFAKDLGEHETLAALTESIRERLAETAKQTSESKLRDQLVEKLVEKNPLELPPSLVQQQQQGMLQEYLQILQMTGQPPSFGDDLIEDMKKRAEQKVRAGLLMGAVAKEQKLEITPEDMDKRFEEMAERTGKHIAKLKAETQGEQRQGLESMILEEKLLEYLLGQATITDAPK
jgi:trigger factor